MAAVDAPRALPRSSSAFSVTSDALGSYGNDVSRARHGPLHMSQRYVAWLHRWRHVVALAFLAVTCFAGWAAPRLLSAVRPSYVPPPGTQAYAQNEAVAQPSVFPKFAATTDVAVYVGATAPNVRLDKLESLDAFTKQFNESVWAYPPGAEGLVGAVLGYYLLVDQGMPANVCNQLMAYPNATGTVIVVQLDRHRLDLEAVAFAQWASGKAQELVPHDAPFHVFVTGVPAMVHGLLDGLERDMTRIDVVTVPLALLVLCLILRTWRLMAIPLFPLICAVATSFAIMYLVTLVMDVFVLVPEEMMSVCVAFGVDFGLFLLTRYRVELINSGGMHVQSVERMVQYAGHTILVSGGTMAICFLGLTLYSLTAVRSMGLGLTVTIIATVTANVVLVPLMLLSFPAFFTKSAKGFGCCEGGARRRHGARGHSSFGVAAARDVDPHMDIDAYHRDSGRWPTASGQERPNIHLADAAREHASDSEYIVLAGDDTSRGGSLRFEDSFSDLNKVSSRQHGSTLSATSSRHLAYQSDSSFNVLGRDTVETKQQRESRMRRSLWYHVTATSASFPCNVIVLLALVGGSAALGSNIAHMNLSDNLVLQLPADAPATRGYVDLVRELGYGAVFPYQIIFQQPEGVSTSAVSEPLFQAVQTAIAEWTSTGPRGLPQTYQEDFQGLMFNFGANYTASFIEYAAALGRLPGATGIVRFVAELYARMVNVEGTATALVFQPTFDPVAPIGHQWLDAMRTSLADFSERTGYRTYMVGNAQDSCDIMSQMYGQFPRVTAAVLGVVLVTLGLAFRSVAIPVQSVLTLSVTISAVFGIVVLVVQDGILDWTGIKALQGLGQVYWLVPPAGVAMIVGLALDYACFLLTHIVEARREGRTDVDAIATAAYRSGHIITSCGTVMFVAFCGLLLSSNPGLNLMGLFITVAVLLDTFVVRTLLVPAMMGLTGRYNWWPMPQWSGPAK